MFFGFVWLAIFILLAILIAASIRILREYERGVVFTLGRFWMVKGPGLVLLYRLDVPKRFPEAWARLQKLERSINEKTMIRLNAIGAAAFVLASLALPTFALPHKHKQDVWIHRDTRGQLQDVVHHL